MIAARILHRRAAALRRQWPTAQPQPTVLASSLATLTDSELADQPADLPEVERERCRRNPSEFIAKCQIQTEDGTWIPFDPWPAQRELVAGYDAAKLHVWLKARQLGLTWIALGLALREMVFRPGITVLLFSLREAEACELIEKLRGMAQRLPPHLSARMCPGMLSRPSRDTGHLLVLANGARAKAFPANRGDSYTATLAIIDEADLIHNLDGLLGSVKPTIDAGGRMILLSRSNKQLVNSTFKRIYRAAVAGENSYRAAFLPWHARPTRTPAWYEEERRNSLAQTGSLDSLYEQYPATDVEALAANVLDKRIPPEWLSQCYSRLEGLHGGRDILALVVPGPGGREVGVVGPAIPGLVVYRGPAPGPPKAGEAYRRFVIGADSAEGNPTSDDSSLTVLDRETGEECAVLSAKLQPHVFARYISQVSDWFNGADVMCERNNHGHTVIGWLRDNSSVKLLTGHDNGVGWLSSSKGKAILYDTVAEAFRQRETILHSAATMYQLALIEGATLRAPEGEHDDRADSYGLALVGITRRSLGLELRVI